MNQPAVVSVRDARTHEAVRVLAGQAQPQHRRIAGGDGHPAELLPRRVELDEGEAGRRDHQRTKFLAALLLVQREAGLLRVYTFALF